MGNPHQGEVSFEANGTIYTFKLGTYAMAVLERKTGKKSAQFFNRKEEEWGVSDLLDVFYACLLRQHKMTEEQVADLIDTIGVDRAGAVLAEAVQAAYPSASAAVPTENPPGAKSA